jgi:hypothetical protein
VLSLCLKRVYLKSRYETWKLKVEMIKKLFSTLIAMSLIFFQASLSEAGSSIRLTSSDGIRISWNNPTSKPSSNGSVNVKVNIYNPTKDNIIVIFDLTDANGISVGDSGSGIVRSGRSSSTMWTHYDWKLAGSKAPYTASFEIVGGNYDYLDSPFAFEVPSTITCLKKGKPTKKITAYKPKCPTGYTKKK